MLENTNTKQTYPGPILNTTLQISTFLFKDPEQVKLTKTYTNDEGIQVEENLTYGTDYEVTKTLTDDISAADANLTASVGEILLKPTVSVLAGQKLTAYRESELTQEISYPRTGPFPAKTHEGALDYLTMQNQEQQEQIDRSLKVPVSTGQFNASMPIPIAARALKINSEGTGFEMSEYDPDLALALTENFKNQAQQAAVEAENQRNVATQQVTLATQQAQIATQQVTLATQQAQIATQQVTLATQQAQIATEKAVEATSAVEEFAGITNVPYTMFESRYFEIKLDNASWLRADTGAYWAKAVYQEQYEALQVEQNAEIADGEVVTLPIGKEYVKKGLSVKLSTETFDDYDFVLNITDETFRLPLKSKLASGKAVVGNGISLGITDGSNYFGVLAPNVNPYPMQALTNMYGVEVGHSGSGGAYLSSNVAVGVTTDPTKSGIETSDSGLYLYFYVGETVQNANLINAGRIEEQLATKVDKFDAYKYSIPDYTNTIQVGAVNNTIAFTSYTAPVDGLLNLGWGAMINATNTIKILVNGHGVAWGYKTGNASFTTSFPVNAGDVVTWQLATGTSGSPYVYGFLCPYKEGGN